VVLRRGADEREVVVVDRQLVRWLVTLERVPTERRSHSLGHIECPSDSVYSPKFNIMEGASGCYDFDASVIASATALLKEGTTNGGRE
jgi:hypothetical protein